MDTPPPTPDAPPHASQPLKAGAKTSEGALMGTVVTAGLAMAVSAEGNTQLAYFGIVAALAALWAVVRGYLKRGTGGAS